MRTITLAGLLGRELDGIENKNAPLNLYIDGPMEIPIRSPRVSVIGTRRPGSDGIAEARTLSGMLVRHGITVVGGLAEGIDTVSHKAAIAAGGNTIAVLGTPLDRAYPISNQRLQEEIIGGHLAVSQFPLGSPITGGNFVRRNMAMAMISDASVIVEAGAGNGTIHHGRAALKLGRPLFLCGQATASGHRGLADLVRLGAHVIGSHNEIIDVIFGKPVARNEYDCAITSSV